MQLYRWRARSMAGKLYQGSYLADSKQEVAAFLHENYDYITGIEEVQSFTVKISRLFNSGKVNDKERSRFFQQLAAMIGSGIPLCRALELLKTRCPVSLTNVCCLLIADLQAGKALSAAMKKHVHIFRPVTVSVIEAGEQGGILQEMLSELAVYFGQKEEINRFLKNICLYPCLVLSLADDMQIRLAEVCLQPPLGRGQEFYENTLTAGRKINGDFNKYNDLICVGEAGDILETLDIGAYKKWSHYSFLTDDEYRQLGFGKGIYYSDDLYGARLPCIVEALKGDAFLISEKNITIENNLHLLGRVTIVVGDNLIIGDNVQMERALLIVKNNLRIGTNCRIKGFVAAGGEITIGVNFSLQRREDVLEPYFAAMYLE